MKYKLPIGSKPGRRAAKPGGAARPWHFPAAAQLNRLSQLLVCNRCGQWDAYRTVGREARYGQLRCRFCNAPWPPESSR